jgi:hypothetical protein
MWYFILDVLKCIWVWIRQNICIPIRLDCIWWFICVYCIDVLICLWSPKLYTCMCMAECCDIYMVMYGFMHRYASVLVFPEVVEYLCTSISKLWSHLFACLDISVCLYFPEVVECMYMRMAVTTPFFHTKWNHHSSMTISH